MPPLRPRPYDGARIRNRTEPAMSPPKPRARLFVSDALAEGAAVGLERAQAHYLTRVMRMTEGEDVALFNGRDGEWRAVVSRTGKNDVVVTCAECLRPQTAEPDIWLVFAPLKKSPMDFLIEKATELGVTRLMPVLTERTSVARVNLERFRAQAIEAAEQCERLTVPEILPLTPLMATVSDWPESRRLLVMDETRQSRPIAEVLRDARNAPGASPDYGILIGPEGGFAPSELDALRKHPIVTTVTAGPRILRAETAAVAALACWQALIGDWV